MSKFNNLYESIKVNLYEKGEKAGKLELVKTDLETARKFAQQAFEKKDTTLEDAIPNFDNNYKMAQKKAGMGKTKRKDMPVIKNTDVKQLQQRLSQGSIDVNAPVGDETNVSDPFPQGLKGKRAEAFLKGGLKVHDGNDKDDKVKVTKGTVPVGNLKPIQQQIYFDKSIGMTAPFGVKRTKDFLQSSNNFYITSSDNYIIDGHHRFLQGVLIDPNMKVPVLKIDLPLSKLLPMSLAYGDAIGNDRNA